MSVSSSAGKFMRASATRQALPPGTRFRFLPDGFVQALRDRRWDGRLGGIGADQFLDGGELPRGTLRRQRLCEFLLLARRQFVFLFHGNLKRFWRTAPRKPCAPDATSPARHPWSVR